LQRAIEESGHQFAENFDWLVQMGFLLKYNGSYSLFSMDLVWFVQSKGNQLSQLEILGEGEEM
jgi:hypothetical protein